MFDTPFFAPRGELLQGALVGFVFGFLLQRGGVTRYQVILGQFLLKDFTVLKVMGTAIVVGGLGVYGMLQMGMLEATQLHIKTAFVYANLLGGLIFGVGMVVLGYCPGTAVAAIGDGSRHAIPGLMGLIAGAGVYAETHAWVNEHINSKLNLGKATLATETGVAPLWWVAGLVVVAFVGFALLERWERKQAKGG